MNPRRFERNVCITRAYFLGFTSTYLARSFGLSGETVRHHVRETCKYLNESAYLRLSPGFNRRTGCAHPPRLDVLRANAREFLGVRYG